MKQEFIKILLVMAGGSLGALCRYGASLLAVRFFGTHFAWGTLMVNLAGCFLIGLTFGLADRSQWMGTLPRLFFVTGYLGGLTTFSAFALESTTFFRAGTHWPALASILANNILGVALVFAGMWVGRLR